MKTIRSITKPAWARHEDSDVDVSITDQGNPMTNWGRSLAKRDGFGAHMNQWATIDAETGDVTLDELGLNVYIADNEGLYFTDPIIARAYAHELIAAIDAYEAVLEEAGL